MITLPRQPLTCTDSSFAIPAHCDATIAVMQDEIPTRIDWRATFFMEGFVHISVLVYQYLHLSFLLNVYLLSLDVSNHLTVDEIVRSVFCFYVTSKSVFCSNFQAHVLSLTEHDCKLMLTTAVTHDKSSRHYTITLKKRKYYTLSN